MDKLRKQELEHKIENASPLDFVSVLQEIEQYEKEETKAVIDDLHKEFKTEDDMIEKLVVPVFTSVIDGFLEVNSATRKLRKKGITASKLVSECSSFTYEQSQHGLNVPKLEGELAEELKAQLFPGASVGNPIDILATGTPDHLRICIDYCEEKLDNIDAILAIFGTPGLVTMFEMYDVLHEKMQTCHKPIFPVLPSINTAGAEVAAFLAKGHVNFSDEVTLGTALSRIVNAPKPAVPEIELFGVDVPRIRRIIDSIPENGYIEPHYVQALLHAAGISLVDEFVSNKKEEVVDFARRCGFPVVAKVVGPVHKSDVGGVVLNIKGEQHLALEFDRMMQIPDAKAIMVQPMLKGTELFIGAKYEEKFGHVVLCGLGGIFVEVLKDVSSGLAPLSYEEAYSMIRSLRAYKIIQGTRGQKGVNEDKFAEIIVRLSTLLRFATEIKEMDINPLLATEKAVIAVDARIRIEK